MMVSDFADVILLIMRLRRYFRRSLEKTEGGEKHT